MVKMNNFHSKTVTSFCTTGTYVLIATVLNDGNKKKNKRIKKIKIKKNKEMVVCKF